MGMNKTSAIVIAITWLIGFIEWMFLAYKHKENDYISMIMGVLAVIPLFGFGLGTTALGAELYDKIQSLWKKKMQ